MIIDPSDPAPVAGTPLAGSSASATPRASLEGLPPGDVVEASLLTSRDVASDTGHVAAPVAPPRPRPQVVNASPVTAPYKVTQLPTGARTPKCSRSTRGNERRIETAHYRYHAVRPAAGRLWSIAVYPVSAGARYYINARGEPLTFTCPLAALPAFIDQTERELEGYWGDCLDTRLVWD